MTTPTTEVQRLEESGAVKFMVKGTRRPRGRPRELTEENIPEIIDLVEKGVDPRIATTSLTGVNDETYWRWLREDTPFFVNFAQRLHKAERDCEAQLVDALSEAAVLEGDTATAKWLLERRFHERWKRRDKYEVTGPNGGPIQIDVRMVSVFVRLAEKYVPPELLPAFADELMAAADEIESR